MKSNNLLPDSLQDELATLFAKAAAEIAADTGIDDDAIDISESELALALKEASKDLVIMVMRRMAAEGTCDGLSIGKLAGILVFRLSRYRIVLISTKYVDGLDQRQRRISNKLQELAAIRMITENVLKVHPQQWCPELLYLLSRRHINQEMLGVSFDIIASYAPVLRTKTPLDKAPFNAFYRRIQTG